MANIMPFLPKSFSIFLKLKVAIKGRGKNNVSPYERGIGKNNHINPPKFYMTSAGISWVLLASGHLIDPLAEEGPQCRNSVT